VIVSSADVYRNYHEINEEFELENDAKLSNDKNVEDPALLIGVRKWSWDNCDPNGPDFSSLGLKMIEHVEIHSKYDIFIYAR
jgi:hypothetical protein